jgi:hypothetical protein
MRFNEVVYYNNEKGIIKGFSKDSKTVYVEFPGSKALIPIIKSEIRR